MAEFYCKIVPKTKTVSAAQKEKGSYFLCPQETVMTGRYHSGDENGQTNYEYASLKAVDEDGNTVAGTITVEDITWSSAFKESSGKNFQAGANRVIVGRQHSGDENGKTQYATAIVKINGLQATVTDVVTSDSKKESSWKWFKATGDRFIIGRYHNGDENGKTSYTSGRLEVYGSYSGAAPIGTVIVPKERSRVNLSQESDSEFICPSNTVMTGRSHTGDENGATGYEYASLKAVLNGEIVKGKITVEDVKWESYSKAEDSGYGFDASLGRVIVGRRHTGDETGLTQYATGVIKFNGYPTEIRDYSISEAKKESGGWNWFVAPNNGFITGRHHYNDENGKTYYCYGSVHCDIEEKPKERFRVVVALHSQETYMPMRPDDFIVLSRFRRHNDGAADDGYNKILHEFVEENNEHADMYYNIPVSVINDSCLKGENVLYTLRPFNEFSLKKGELFLEPDDNLSGDMCPNGRVPVYYYSADGLTPYNIDTGTLQIYMFFGYNDVQLLGRHQGDWESITIFIDKGKITTAWLSHHTSTIRFDSSELDITEEDGIQVLTVYCDKGTHALYNKGRTISQNGIATDSTDNAEYKWIITDCMRPLAAQPWKLFSGAWGEKGQMSMTTGPLGPWYNRSDKWTIDTGALKISDLIDKNEYLIVPYDIANESVDKESDSLYTAPANKVIVGRIHSGDENAGTTYFYASLKAIDINGNTIDGAITVENVSWTEEHSENSSDEFFIAQNNRVITGRQHDGGENGMTKYQSGQVYFNGKLASVDIPPTSSSYPNVSYRYAVTENLGMQFCAPENFVLIGRVHNGDKTGKTYYHIGYIHIRK